MKERFMKAMAMLSDEQIRVIIGAIDNSEYIDYDEMPKGFGELIDELLKRK